VAIGPVRAAVAIAGIANAATMIPTIATDIATPTLFTSSLLSPPWTD
jgi:hypothetical protein